MPFMGIPYRADPPASTLYPVPDLDSQKLVARCQAGDNAAYRDLYNKHRSEVARLIFRMLGPRAEIDDLIQETFIHVFRSIRDFRGDARFSTWLHRLTVNVVLMHRRSAKSRPQSTDEISPTMEAVGLSPDDDVIRRQRLRAFYGVLEKLPEKKRTVFILHEVEGLSPSEIAEIVDAPVLTVRTRLFYARRELIQLLREEPVLCSLAAMMVRPGSADLASDDGARESSP